MRYKVGDIVKLRDDLEINKKYDGVYYTEKMNAMKNKPIKLLGYDNCIAVAYYVEEDGETWYLTDEMIEGLWEECKGITYEPYKEKTNKYKLIDILNKIANGELKEGTKVIYCGTEYELRKSNNGASFDLFNKKGEVFFYENYIGSIRNEVELIEPYQFREDTKMIEPKECEHEWKNYTVHRIGEGIIRRYKHCKKCGLEEDIEPICEHEWEKYTLEEIGTESVELKHRRYCKICGIDEEEPIDNTTEKIEELRIKVFRKDYFEFRELDKGFMDNFLEIQHKLNEVIRYINKENNNE